MHLLPLGTVSIPLLAINKATRDSLEQEFINRLQQNFGKAGPGLDRVPMLPVPNAPFVLIWPSRPRTTRSCMRACASAPDGRAALGV